MKKLIQLIFFIICLPFLIFINPLTIRLFREIKIRYTSLMMSLRFQHNFYGVYAKAYPKFHGVKYIKIGRRTGFGYNNVIEAYDSYHGNSYKPSLIIEDGVHIGNNCHFGSINKIVIGEDTLIGSNVLIIDHNHSTDEKGLPIEGALVSKGEVIIGKRCWIGENVSIMPGVKIGDNALIGANTVVTKDVPANSKLVNKIEERYI